MRLLSVALLLVATGCDRGPSARGLAAGRWRITPDDSGPTPLSESAVLRARIEYAGSRRVLEWRPELRLRGRPPSAATSWSRESWKPPGTDAKFAVTVQDGTTFQVGAEFTAGNTTLGTTRLQLRPPAKSLLLRGASPETWTLDEGEEAVIGAVLADLPPDRAGASLEEAVAAASWALVFRVRLAP